MSASIYPIRPSTDTSAWGLSEYSPEATNDAVEVGSSEAKDQIQDNESESLAELRALLHQGQVKITTISTKTLTFGLEDKKYRLNRELVQALEAGEPIQLRRPNDVPLHSLLSFLSVSTLAVSLFSLVMWLADFPPLINPFAALLGVVASPFLYFMGQAARIRPGKQ